MRIRIRARRGWRNFDRRDRAHFDCGAAFENERLSARVRVQFVIPAKAGIHFLVTRKRDAAGDADINKDPDWDNEDLYGDQSQ